VYYLAFLSTLSLRRATLVVLCRTLRMLFLSTLSLRRATGFGASRPKNNQISIHALLAESDCFGRIMSALSGYFYPRSPCGERRYSFRHSAQSWHFYPRSPCGERLKNSPALLGNSQFLSTLSLRRATPQGCFLLP